MVATCRRRVSAYLIFVVFIAGFSGRLHAQEDSPEYAASRDDSPPHFVVLRLSGAMLNTLIDKQLDVQTTVRDVILGTPVSGTARMTGESQVVLEPSNDQARFAVSVSGTVHSQTVGRNGPATIYSRSITRFTATKRIVFEPGKGFFGGPPRIAAQTQVYTDRIAINRGGIIGRMIQRRAWEQVGDQKAQVTAIARQRATTRIAAAFENHLDQRLARLNRAVDFGTTVANLRDQATGTPQLACSTTPQYIEIADTLASDRRAVALPVLSSASEANAPIEVWIHQRLVPNRMASLFKSVLSSPDQNALLKGLTLLPGPVGKDAALALTTFVGDNQFSIQTLGDWTVVEINARPAEPVVVAQNTRR
jgi:hypothetical protein